MSQRQGMHSRPPTVNGSGRRRTEKDLGSRPDKMVYPARSISNSSGNASGGHGISNNLNSDYANQSYNTRLQWEGPVSGTRGGEPERTRNDRLIHITMLLIGQPVDVQVKNGSIYSGIFHTANIEKDYGVVLKMARLTKDGNAKGGPKDMLKDSIKKTPAKTFIILAKDLVQVIAKDVPLNGDRIGTGRARDNKYDIITDTYLSQSQQIEVERELKPWTPDKDGPENVDLENTFQNTWNRNWDQFETNKSLFGVESTFDEELYTTKLERGPQTKELERKASIIAREIEEQTTGNFHIAEERGFRFAKELDTFDEETKYSSVLRSEDIGEDNEDKYIDSHNDETFGSVFSCTEDVSSFLDDSRRNPSIAGEPDKKADVSKVINEVNCVDSTASLVNSVNRDSNDQNIHEEIKNSKQQMENHINRQSSSVQTVIEKSKGLEISGWEVSSDRLRSPPMERSDILQKSEYSDAEHISSLSSRSSEAVDVVEPANPTTSSKGLLAIQPDSHQEQLPLTSVTGNSVLASEPTSSANSSVGTAKKSTLNPNAKEFKLNPNAKSFTPCFTTPRQQSSVVQGPMYAPSSIPSLAPMQTVAVGLGVNSLLQQASQPAKFSQYNNTVATAGLTASYLQPATTFVPCVSGASVPTALPAPPPIKISPPGQQVVAHSFNGQQPIRYTSQGTPIQQAPAYVHPGGQMYSQPMVYGQPGLVYANPYSNDMIQGTQISNPQGSVPPQAASHQVQQSKHRGTAVHGMQYCVASPFVTGQQPYIQCAPLSHLPNSLQPSPGVLTSTSLPGIQIPQGIVAGIGPTVQNGNGLSGSNGIWVGGRGTTGNFQQ